MKPASNPTTADLQKVSRDLALLHTEHVTFKNSVALPDDKHFDLFTIKNGALQQNERWRHKRTKAVASFIRKCLVVADSHINVELLINVHDKYDGEFSNYPVLAFGKSVTNRPEIIEIPSLYLLDGTVKRRCWKTKKVDPPFHLKRGKVCFYGASTGDLDTDNNQRVQAAIWAQDKKNMIIKITNWCQGADQDLISKGLGDLIPLLSDKTKSIRRQLLYKYLLNIDGNATSWDRFIWQLYSNSLSLKLESNQTEFWYPLLEDRHNFVSVTLDNLEEVIAHFSANKDEVLAINKQSRSLVFDWLLNPDFLKSYMIHVLTFLSEKFSD